MYETSLTCYVIHFITKQMQLHPEKLFFAKKHFSLYTISKKLGGPREGVKIWKKLFLVFFPLIVSQMEYQSTQGGQLFQKNLILSHPNGWFMTFVMKMYKTYKYSQSPFIQNPLSRKLIILLGWKSLAHSKKALRDCLRLWSPKSSG